MKTTMISLRRWTVFALTLCWVQLASAYYDPGEQRWINRDPIQEVGGPNLHTFVNNSPVLKSDAVGLQGCSRGPCTDPCGDAQKLRIDHGDAGGTVCCGGKAYACVWDPSGPTGTAKGKARSIIAKCIGVHEQTHVPDTACPAVGGPTRGAPRAGRNLEALECNAYRAEMSCLKSSVGQCDGDPQCIAEVFADMRDVRTQISANCK